MIGNSCGFWPETYSSVDNMSFMVPYIFFLSRLLSSSAILTIFIFSFVFLIALAVICLSARENALWDLVIFSHLLTQHCGSWDIHSRTYILRMILSIYWTCYFSFSFLPPNTSFSLLNVSGKVEVRLCFFMGNLLWHILLLFTIYSVLLYFWRHG